MSPQDPRDRGHSHAAPRAGHGGHPDHRHHLLRPGRRRVAGRGGRGHRLSRQALQPARPVRDDPQADYGGPRDRVMKRAGWWLIAAVLLVSPGCAKPADWIESTLVTVDVSGVWEGMVPAAVVAGTAGGAGGAGVPAVFARLTLEQGGPKVKGTGASG